MSGRPPTAGDEAGKRPPHPVLRTDLSPKGRGKRGKAVPYLTSPSGGEVEAAAAREGALAKGTPFTSTRKTIPVTVVTVVTAGPLPVLPGAALITIEPETGHDHAGAECLVCATRGNVRVLLFELLEQARLTSSSAPVAVVVDARQAADAQAVIDALVPGRLPAFGLRDHTVGRSFRLA